MPRKFPNLTIHFWRFFYHASRKPSKPRKLHCAYGGKMDEAEFNRCMEILNGNKK